ncbi:MAG: 50S ribosomal protein L19, partial [Elusimicrobiota bacterium]|nr:50S ribosomal protein L19 [Elusimicrobiota bacterium]
MDSIIHKIEASFKKANIPTFKAGDKLKLHLKVKEGTSERVQIFEGDVIARQGAGISENIIIRKISNGVGVEKTLCLHSPNIEKIEVVKIGKVRRAKLYYIRHRVGKTAKIVEKKTSQ